MSVAREREARVFEREPGVYSRRIEREHAGDANGLSSLTQADAPRAGSRQYHIALERGELAEYVLLVGDPGRVAKVASRWDSRRARAQQP